MSKYHPIASNILPTRPRDVNETHRAATPLELLFDLVSVIAIAAAAAGLHHAIAEAHFSEGIIKFLAAFFAIWWAWMNYTWFASAYDNNDALFRLLTMVVMAGALTMAAGIPLFFESTDLRLIVIGFVIMRVAMVSLWLRAAKHDIAGRKTALSYAIGIAIAQVYWVGLLIYQGVTGDWFFPLFAIGAVFELMVPAYAERQGVTPWHRHHLIERYGLLNIIVLGETLLAGSFAVNHAAKSQFDLELVRITVSALIILFAMWWLYFSREDHIREKSLSLALLWGYGHLIIYASGAAVGAGFAVLVDVATQHASISLRVGHFSVAVPVALYMTGLWLVRDRIVLTSTAQWVLPICAVLVLLAPLLLGLEGIAAIMVLAVYTRNYFACRDKFESQ